LIVSDLTLRQISGTPGNSKRAVHHVTRPLCRATSTRELARRRQPYGFLSVRAFESDDKHRPAESSRRSWTLAPVIGHSRPQP